MPMFQHEATYYGFLHKLTIKAQLIGLLIDSLFLGGATRYYGHSNFSFKEGNSGHKPRAF